MESSLPWGGDPPALSVRLGARGEAERWAVGRSAVAGRRGWEGTGALCLRCVPEFPHEQLFAEEFFIKSLCLRHIYG